MSRWKVGLIFIICATLAAAVFFLYQNQGDDAKRVAEKQFASVQRFGPLNIGDDTLSGPGDWTFAPYMEIPAAKFYVTVVNDEFWCSNEDCGLDGAFIQTMGGWLQVESVSVNSDLPSMSGLDLEENKNVKSVVLIGNSDGKIVGIYPNRTLDDALGILRQHPDLADFGFLNGVNDFGMLKVGELAPLKPGDPISNLSDELEKNSKKNVPEGKNFYIYGIEKRKYDMVGMYEKYKNEYVCFLGSCRYPEPDPPHDFLYADIYELNGWFLANDINGRELIKLFGMEPEEVLSGRMSLVVVTDPSGVIAALHPGKTLSDTLTILSQLPSDFRRQISATSSQASLLRNFLGWE